MKKNHLTQFIDNPTLSPPLSGQNFEWEKRREMEDDLEYELSYLSAYDMHPFQDKDMKKAPGATVRARAEKNVQLLINKLFASERVEVRLFSKFSKISPSLLSLSHSI